jgi:hypothetical protein
MRVHALSDLHGHLPPVDPCDVLVLAGDVCPFDDHSVAAQAAFLAGPFADWLDAVPAGRVVGIAGNHDFVFADAPDRVPDRLRWTYLQDSGVTVDGLHFYGSPWCPEYGRWAFNLDEAGLAAKWAMIPAGLDVLLTHTPPFGVGDRAKNGGHVGSRTLARRLQSVRPRLLIVGHIHEARGMYVLPTGGGHATTVVNVAHLDPRYEPRHPPMAFDLEVQDSHAID